MLANAVQAAIVVAQLTNIVRPLGHEIAIQQIRFLVVDADVKRSGRLCFKAFYRGIAVNRIEFIRLNIAEKFRLGLLFRIVGSGQKITPENLSLDEKCCSSRSRAIIAGDGELAQFAIKGVILLDRTQSVSIEIADVNHTFDYPCGNKRPQLRIE